MRITLCMPIAEARGGSEVLLERLVASAAAAGLDLSVVFLEDGPMVRAFREQGIPTAVVEAGRLRDVGRYARVVRAISADAQRHGADVIVSWMTKAHLYASLAAKHAGVPALWYQHGVPNPADPITRLATMLPAQGILACSQSIADAQQALFPYRPTRSVPPCVDLARFSADALPDPIAARSGLGLPVNGPLVGIVARLQRWKGVHVYVDAMARVLENVPSAHGVIVGGQHDLEPDYSTFIAERIQSLGLSDRIRCAGFQSNVPLWMQAMDVFVHASDREPFGMVIIEAMALGKPVIASAEGGPKEIITSGVDGVLVPYGASDLLATTIIDYLSRPRFASRIGAAARHRASEFSDRRYADRFAQAVAHTLPTRQRASSLSSAPKS
jgi:glycosyltransferase involved in cell wall biosynthesis